MRTRTAVIIQARLGSSRLRGKVLERLGGLTVLARVLERCTVIDGIDVLCCAVPSSSENDLVAEEAIRAGAVVFRGSEDDVLERYYFAAREVKAAVVLRVTSDCPLLDPHIATEVLRLVTQRGADYACNNMPPTWPHGLDCEAFRFDWLERAAREAVLPSEREHVTPFIRNHAHARKLLLSAPRENLAEHRWTLDTEKDLLFLKALFNRLPEGTASFSYEVPLGIIESDPALRKLNAGQDRDAGWKKSLTKDVAFRTTL